jgi:putative transposase
MNRESRRRALVTFDYLYDPVGVRTAYRCRAYPDEQQQAVLKRIFGCVRMVWNRTLAGTARPLARRAQEHLVRGKRSGADRHEEGPELAFLNEFDLPQ